MLDMGALLAGMGAALGRQAPAQRNARRRAAKIDLVDIGAGESDAMSDSGGRRGGQ